MSPGREADKARDLRGFGVVIAAGAVVLPLLPEVGPLCPLRRLTGIPCPFCGMTTAMVALLRLQPADAFMANPAALLLAVAILVACLPAAARRRPTIDRSRLGPLAWLAVPLLWVWQLHRFELI
jgi:hypothetical protein